MNRRLGLLLTLALGALIVGYVEWAFFTTLGPRRAIFLQLAIFATLTTLGTVLARNLVHAALYLVGFFFLVACLFVLLEAEFIAAMQVLVYIGAVAVLLMFGIMLTRNIQGDDTTSAPWVSKLPAAVVAVGLAAVLSFGIVQQKRSGPGREWREMKRFDTMTNQGQPNDRYAAVNDMGRALGRELMTRWVLPFEVAGLLLTAALVGAVALARTDDDEVQPSAGESEARARIETAPSGNGHNASARPAEPVHTS